MNAPVRDQRQCQVSLGITVTYAVGLAYLLLSPAPLFFWGTSGAQLHEDVNLIYSTYLQHTTAFIILTALVTWTCRMYEWRMVWHGLVPTIGFALGTEFLQRFIPNRSGELWDVLADFAGILIAVVVVSLNVYLRQILVSPGEGSNAL